MAEITYANSWVKVCNRALRRLGAQEIQALSEGSSTANLCSLYLGEAVGDIVECYDWNCLKKRVELAQLSDDPVNGYEYQYQLPSDFARLIEIDNSGLEYSLEGNVLLTDADDDVYLTYIAYPTDSPQALPETLLTAISLHLCSLLALPLTSNNSLYERLIERATTARANAINQDARGNYPDEREYDYTEEVR